MPPEEDHRIRVHLSEILKRREMSVSELAQRLEITLANASNLKTGKARAIRFTTLTRLCDVLDCQPGDILTCSPAPDRRPV